MGCYWVALTVEGDYDPADAFAQVPRLVKTARIAMTSELTEMAKPLRII